MPLFHSSPSCEVEVLLGVPREQPSDRSRHPQVMCMKERGWRWEKREAARGYSKEMRGIWKKTYKGWSRTGKNMCLHWPFWLVKDTRPSVHRESKDLSPGPSFVTKPQGGLGLITFLHEASGSFSVKQWDRPGNLQCFCQFCNSVHHIFTQAP